MRDIMVGREARVSNVSSIMAVAMGSAYQILRSATRDIQ